MSCLLVVRPPSFRTCAVDNRFPMGTCTPPHAKRPRRAPYRKHATSHALLQHCARYTQKNTEYSCRSCRIFTDASIVQNRETNTMAGAPRSNDTRGKFDLRALQCRDAPPTRGKVGVYLYIFVAVGPAQSVGTARPVGDNGSAGGFAG